MISKRGLLGVVAVTCLVATSSSAQTFTAFSLKFGRSGGADGAYGNGPGELFDPERVLVDATGDIWVADVLNHRVQRFDPLGSFLSGFGEFGTGNGQFNSPRGIALDETTGEVYVVDSLNDRVQVFDREGNYVRGWGSSGSGDGQFAFPRGMALDGTGSVFVTDMDNHRVQVFDTQGAFQTKWGSFGAADGQFQYPRGIAVDAAGRILVVDSFNHRVQRFDPDGTFSSKFGANGGDGSLGNGNGEFNTPRDVSVSGNRIWVADTGNDRLQVFTDGGTTVTWLGITGAKGLADGLLNTPRGVFATSVAQYVASSGNHRIDVFGSPVLQRTVPVTGPVSAPAPGEDAGLAMEVELLPLGSDPYDLTAVARFQLPRDGSVRVVLTDAAGSELRVLQDGELTAGVHEVRWKAAGPGAVAGGRSVACRVETADARSARTVALP